MKLLKRTHRAALPAWTISCLLLTANGSAQIVTDGSVGPAQNLSGPDFSIPESLGSQAGGNLFHSFRHFNILNGQSATFSGAAEIANVISRVTGGNASMIDGLLRSTIGQADFYFLNPDGVMFGENAQVDVPGSFYVSTADQLRFADGSVYNAKNPTASTLSFAQPDAFGFLGDQTATISLQGSNIMLSPDNTLSLSAGELKIDSSRLFVERGDIQLIATGDGSTALSLAGEVSTPAQGELIIGNSLIDSSGDGAGRFVVRGGASRISSSGIFAVNIGPTDASSEQGIDIHASSLELESSRLAADTFGQGQAANFSVTVERDLSIVNGSTFSSATFAAGHAGEVNVTAGTLTVDRQGSDLVTGISSSAEPNSGGNAGIVTVTVTGDVSIVNGGTVRSSAFAVGDGGQVSVTATGAISIVNGGGISSITTSTGPGGQVSVKADTLTVDGQSSQRFTGITSQAAPGSNGNAGSVKVTVDDTLSIVSGGEISNSTFGAGDGGQVSVKAGTLTIDGKDSPFFTGVSSGVAPNSSGNAGPVTVTIDDAVSIINGGLISSATFGAGDGSQVRVTAGTVTVDGRGSGSFTGLTSEAGFGSLGQAGNITLDTQNLSIANGGTISIESRPTVDAATLANIEPTGINITAQNVTLTDAAITTESAGNVPAGSITLNVADTLSLDPSRISTAANNADGGAISIQAKVIDLKDSQITTSVTGQGNGGNIDLTAKVLVLDSGFIQANTAGANARGGDIRINTDALVASQNLLITGGSTPLSFQPGLNVIQAAAPDGVSGTINITSPQLDISGDLTNLDAEFLDIGQLAQDPCATPGGRQSRLVRLGRGGLPESPEQAGSVAIDSDRLQRLLPRAGPTRPLPSESAQPVATRHSTLTIESLWLSPYSETDC